MTTQLLYHMCWEA